MNFLLQTPIVMNTQLTRISLVEDKPEISNFLKKIFNESPDFEFEESFDNAKDAISSLPATSSQIVIVDIELPPGKNGIECVRQIKALRPEIQFLMYTQFDEDNKIFESLKAGASGYLLKSPDKNKILDAVRELVNGGAPMSPTIARKITAFFFDDKSKIKVLKLLTKREMEILELLSQGLLYKEIADESNIVIGTVKQHIHNIYQKLHVQNRTEAINKYLGREY